MNKIKVITHFFDDDPDCTGDYSSVTIELNGKIVASYGDYYHSKGRERADGFVDAIKLIYPSATIVYENVADDDDEY